MCPFLMRSIAMCVQYTQRYLVCIRNCSFRAGWWAFITLLLLAQMPAPNLEIKISIFVCVCVCAATGMTIKSIKRWIWANVNKLIALIATKHMKIMLDTPFTSLFRRAHKLLYEHREYRHFLRNRCIEMKTNPNDLSMPAVIRRSRWVANSRGVIVTLPSSRNDTFHSACDSDPMTCK